jgi:membrane-bound ClpP family serine protease
MYKHLLVVLLLLVSTAAVAAPKTAPKQVPYPHVAFKGNVTEATTAKFAADVARALDNGATLIILEIDSVGGSIYYGRQVSAFITSGIVPFICVVTDTAYSVALSIFLSCEVRLMTSNASLGAHQPEHIHPKPVTLTRENLVDSLRVIDETIAWQAAQFEEKTTVSVEEYKERIAVSPWFIDAAKAIEIEAAQALVPSVAYVVKIAKELPLE